jgi:hypothetical protein
VIALSDALAVLLDALADRIADRIGTRGEGSATTRGTFPSMLAPSLHRGVSYRPRRRATALCTTPRTPEEPVKYARRVELARVSA